MNDQLCYTVSPNPVREASEEYYWKVLIPLSMYMTPLISGRKVKNQANSEVKGIFPVVILSDKCYIQ